MYSFDQIKKGLKNPRLLKNELRRSKHRIRAIRRFDYAVTGAYWTGNIGDRAIAEAIREKLGQQGRSAELFVSRVNTTNSKVHILGGGGVLRDCSAAAEDSSITALKHRMDWVSGSNKGAIIGVGVPGFKKAESEQLVKRKLPEVDIITVRDEWSKKTLENYYEGEIHVTACPAFLLDPPEGKRSNRPGVNFRPWPNYPSDIMSYHFDFESGLNISKAKSRYITNIQNICDRLDNPMFIPFAAEDENFARDHLDIDVYPYEFSVKKTLERVANVDKMVSMRYHSLVFSAITETPTLALAYQPKVAALANRLGVESYLPHDTDIRVRFQHSSGVDRLETLANRNFELMDQN